MNFNIYLDNATGRALERLSRRRKISRNALIREAVQRLVQEPREADRWSRLVQTWQGDPGFEPFESHRRDLPAPADDPLA